MSNSELPIAKILTPYQLDWLYEKEPFLVYTKSRRIGISYCEALKSILIANRKENPQNTFYISHNFQAAIDWIDQDVGYWLDRFQIMAEIDDNFMLFDDSQREPIQVKKVTFKTGKSIYALPSKASSLRGRKGRIVLDEANYIPDLEGMITAALAFKMWGNSQISIISTQGDVNGEFNQLVEAIESGAREGKLYKTDLINACQQGLYKKICAETNQEWSQGKEQDWIKETIREYGQAAGQELLCEPSTSGDRVFEHTLLLDSVGSAELIVRRDYSEIVNPGRVLEQINQLFHGTIKASLAAYNVGRNITAQYIGVDVGRISDLTSIYVLAKDALTGTLLTQLIVELRGTPFDSQKELIKLIVDNLPELEAGAIDGAGIGADLAEAIEYYKPQIQAVKASTSFHNEMWIKLLRKLEEGELKIPNDNLLFKDLGMVAYVDGLPRLSERRQSGRHGDSASSLELCVSSIQRETAHGKRQVGTVWSPRLRKYIDIV